MKIRMLFTILFCNRSALLRRDLKELINKVEDTQQKAHHSVNDGLTGKVSETIGLKVHNVALQIFFFLGCLTTRFIEYIIHAVDYFIK